MLAWCWVQERMQNEIGFWSVCSFLSPSLVKLARNFVRWRQRQSCSSNWVEFQNAYFQNANYSFQSAKHICPDFWVYFFSPNRAALGIWSDGDRGKVAIRWFLASVQYFGGMIWFWHGFSLSFFIWICFCFLLTS